jgi:DNA polymerase-3 subunit gamma/tau
MEGISPDVVEIDGASNRGIDEIRELREKVKFTPTKFRYKVYIIDEVHMLTDPAFNALLKTLEEPPPHVVFIFATTSLHKVPKTITSRCQCFKFKKLSSKDIFKRLEGIALEEGVNAEPHALSLIARKSDGSMRDAESMLDQLMAYGKGDVREEDVITVIGGVRQELLKSFSLALREGNSKGGLEIIRSILDEGVEVSQFIKELMEYFRDLLLVKTLHQKEAVEVIEYEYSQLREDAKGFESATLFKILEILLNLNEKVRKYPLQATLLLEIEFIRMIREMGKKLERVKVSSFISLAEARKVWSQVLEKIKKEKISLWNCLCDSEVKDIRDKCMVIGLRGVTSFKRDTVKKEDNRRIIDKVLKELCEEKIEVCIEDEEEKKRDEFHPIVAKAMELFGGKIVEVKNENLERRG